MTTELHDSVSKETIQTLSANLQSIRYGSVSVVLKVHNGRVVDVTHTVTESTRERREGNA
jgi:hypothetical protein